MGNWDLLISSCHIISIYTKMFHFKKKSLIWYAVKQCVVTHQNVLELFKNNSWIRWFLCQFIHGWQGEYCSVVNCGLPVMAVVLFFIFVYLWKVPCSLSMSHDNMKQLLLFSYTFVHVFVNILIRVIKQNQTNRFFFKWRSRVALLLLLARHSILQVQGRQLCNSSAKISNGHLACSRDTRGHKFRIPRCSDRKMPT